MAMLGVYYQVIIKGTVQTLFGTSCSSPVTAAIVSLLNAARKAQGKSTIGYMNPTLYAAASVVSSLCCAVLCCAVLCC